MYIETLTEVKGFEDYVIANNGGRIDFGRINIFVGPNNSGKSRCLRQMFREFTKKEASDRTPLNTANIQGSINLLIVTLEQVDFINRRQDRIEKLINQDGAVKLLRENVNTMQLEILKKNGVIDLIRALKISSSKLLGNSARCKEFCSAVEKAHQNIVRQYEMNCIDARYIPVNRTLKPYQCSIEESRDKKSILWNYTDVIRERTVVEYFKEEKERHLAKKIFSGQSMYDSLTKNLLGRKDNRKLIADYQTILSETFFDGLSVTLIPSTNSGTVSVQIGEKEYDIYNWGEGMQSLLAITYEMFINKDTDMVFYIEEPEINMHPAMQRQLIDLMTHKDLSSFQIFMTTHSNHFLDVFLEHEEVQFYKFSPHDKQFSIQQAVTADLECLTGLGVRNSSVLLSNCVIWVEGSTDVIYYRKLLGEIMEAENQKPKFIEDYHYTFCYTGGDCVVDYGFSEVNRDAGQINIRALGSKVLVIKDNRMGEVSKSKEYEDLEKALGESFIQLPVHEVENLVSECALEELLKGYYRRTNHKDKEFKGKINMKEYKMAKYSEYLASVYNKEVDESKRCTNIFTEKKGFAKEVMERSCSIDGSVFNEEAYEIGKRILKFIRDSNQN